MKVSYVALFALALNLPLISCRKSSGDPAKAEDTSAGPSALPKDAEIQSLTLESGSDSASYDTYTFSPSELILKGSWVRKNAQGESVKAEGQTEINELEWLLVQQNIQNLKLQPIDPESCGQVTTGEEKVLSVTYLSEGASESLEIPTAKSSVFTCGDYAMPDETFDLILQALKDKLPAPTDLSVYHSI